MTRLPLQLCTYDPPTPCTIALPFLFWCGLLGVLWNMIRRQSHLLGFLS